MMVLGRVRNTSDCGASRRSAGSRFMRLQSGHEFSIELTVLESSDKEASGSSTRPSFVGKRGHTMKFLTWDGTRAIVVLAARPNERIPGWKCDTSE